MAAKKGKEKNKGKDGTALTVQEKTGLGQPLAEMLTEDQKKLIKRCFAKNATDDELSIYFNFCEKAGVDPLRGQSHFIKYKATDKPIMMIGIDGFQSRATSDPRYKGMVANVVYEKDDFKMNPVAGTITHSFGVKDRGKLLGAYAILERKGMTKAVQWVAFEEYYKKGYGGKQNIWDDKPEVMITKVARATLLRREYPDNFSGVYVPEEFGDEITEKGDFIDHQKPDVKPFPSEQPVREAEFTTVPEEKTEEPEPEEDDAGDKVRDIPDDVVDGDMTPREALKAIMKYAWDEEIGDQVRPIICKYYEPWETGEPDEWNIPEEAVIKIVKELTGHKLKKAEKTSKCKNCDKKITEPEVDEQEKLCLVCFKKHQEDEDSD